VIWDASDLLESQIAAVRDLPHGVPALVVMEITDQELTQLDAVSDTTHYPAVLVAILKRIASDRRKETR
jgi:hypothetical protein